MNNFRRILGALAVLLCGHALAQQPEAVVDPAIDGVFEAFKTHPLVGLGDAHGLAQGMEFYAALVRDPRFAREVGNVVAELGASRHQDIMDRYLAGASVPYTELRKVWTDTVGAIPPPFYFAGFFAAVREVNKSLRPEQHVRVWLGEPPLDWSVEKPEWESAMRLRASHPAKLIAENILARGKKALVIYGHNHFTQWKDPVGGGTLYGRIEEKHPGAFFILLPYVGVHQPAACAAFLKQSEKIWPAPALAVFARNNAPGSGMHECATFYFPILASQNAGAIPAAPPAPTRGSQVFDGVLFYGPSQSHTLGYALPEYTLDAEYRLEIYRRSKVSGLPLMHWPKGWSHSKADYQVGLDAPGYVELRDAMFAKYDANHDGVVTDEEYVDPVTPDQH